MTQAALEFSATARPFKTSSARRRPTKRSIVADPGAAIDRGGGPLDMPRPLRAKEQCQCGDILDLADAADAAFPQGSRAHFVNTLAGRGRAPRPELLLPPRRRVAPVHHIHAHAAPRAR